MNNAIPCAALLLAGLITSQTLAACVAPDGNVTFGDHDTGVADRTLGDDCQTLDGLIRDEDAWGSQGEFVRHVVPSRTVSSRCASSGNAMSRGT